MAEKQYDRCFELPKTTLGSMAGQRWADDPKSLLFSLARYKHVARLLDGYHTVAEVGCGDGFASKLVRDVVWNLDLFDFDTRFQKDSGCEIIDIQIQSLPSQYDAIYLLDVFEHIADPHQLMINLCKSLVRDGTLIIGIPSLESQKYASAMSKEGHVNCMSGKPFRDFLRIYMKNVFIFGINDETLTTGFFPMCQYLLAVCTVVR